MKEFKSIIIEEIDKVKIIWLNRPDVHNAMNAQMIEELTFAFSSIEDQTRAIVLRGKGKSFCAGADLNYMKEIASFSIDENFRDSLELAKLFESIYTCSCPTIAVVHGSAFGGANGLLASCDIVLAEESTNFAFSEVKLGIAPATIAPFVIKRIGEFGAKELMITGKRFKAKEALKWNLINSSLPEIDLDNALHNLIKEIKSNGPKAVLATKNLIHSIIREVSEETLKYTAQIIAELRGSSEGQEGMASFLEKRKPNWRTDID